MSSQESLPQFRKIPIKESHACAWTALAIGVSTLIYNSAYWIGCSITLGIALWTALWWIFEAVPIPVASSPSSLLPLFGILSPKVVEKNTVILWFCFFSEDFSFPKPWKKVELIEGLL